MADTEVAERKRKLRFSCFDDINLLKQTVALNPYENNRNWKAVHLNFVKTANKPFTVRAIKDHVEHLLMLYKKRDMGILRRGKSATEKQHTEKEQLLQELDILKERFGPNRKERQEPKPQPTSDPVLEITETKEEVCYETAEDPDLRDLDSLATPSTTATTFVPNASENNQGSSYIVNSKFTPILSKCTVGTAADVSTEPLLEMIQEERKKELDFEKRKLSLEEKKVELESRRLALEEARLKYFLESQKQQHQLMLILIEKITSNSNTNK